MMDDDATVDSDQFLPEDIANAARDGDVSRVDAWIRAGGAVDARECDYDKDLLEDFCLLEIGVTTQNVALVRCVIAHGADVNVTKAYFGMNTALAKCFNTNPMCAFDTGRRDNACFYAMLEAGARVEPSDLLQAAASHGCSEEIVGEVLRRGGDVHHGSYRHDWTPLHGAASRGNPGVIALLLKHGARVNYLSCDPSCGDRWLTPLMAAAQGSCLVPDEREPGDHQTCATVRLLLAHGADLRAVDDYMYMCNQTARDIAVKELEVWRQIRDREYWNEAEILKGASVVALFDEIYAAGSWKRYANEPRVQLLMLRCLCAKGRAAPPPGMVANLLALPTAIFWSVLSFWRTSRDA